MSGVEYLFFGRAADDSGEPKAQKMQRETRAGHGYSSSVDPPPYRHNDLTDWSKLPSTSNPKEWDKYWKFKDDELVRSMQRNAPTSFQYVLECDMKGASGEDHDCVNWFCITCCFNLCDGCKADHESKGKFARHDTILRRDLFQGLSKICEIHPEESTFAVCAPCREAVCKKCITSSHLGKAHFFAI